MHSTSPILVDSRASTSETVYPAPLSSAPLRFAIAGYGATMAPNEATNKASFNATSNSNTPLILEPPVAELDATPSAESVRKTLETDEGAIIADAYQILRLIHEIFVEMRRQAAESRQDDYRDQWTSLEGKAKEMEKAAGHDLGAGLAGGIFGVAGGAAGLYAGTMAMKHTKLAQKEVGADLPQAHGRPDLAANPGGPGAQGIKANGQNAANTTNSNNAVLDDIIDQQPPAQQPANDPDNTLPPADHNPNPAGIDPAPGATQQNAGAQYHNNQALTYSNLSMVMGQSIAGIGGLVTSPIKFVADIDRAESQREDAEAVKAQAGAERESEFWRTASEGSKSALDTTTQLVTSRHEISNKIWS